MQQIPNSKFQIPNKLQASNFKIQPVWDLVLGIWNLF